MIVPGDQNDNLLCLVTKLEIEIRLPFWSLTKFGCLSGHRRFFKWFSFKLLSYLAKRHIFSRFGSQSGHEQIRSLIRSYSNKDINLVVADAFSFTVV